MFSLSLSAGILRLFIMKDLICWLTSHEVQPQSIVMAVKREMAHPTMVKSHPQYQEATYQSQEP